MSITHPLFALMLAVIHGVSGLAILLISSWFIAASAVAAPNFNYMLPAVLIRGLALLRIASGYGEMWLSHHQLLGKLGTLRQKLFNNMESQSTVNRGTKTDQLHYQTEDLASIWAGWINQNATALLSITLMSFFTLVALKDFTDLWLIFAFLALVIYGGLLFFGRQLSIEKLKVRMQLEFDIEHHFNSAEIWHMQPYMVHPDSQKLYKLMQKSQKQVENAISLLLIISLISLVLVLLRTNSKYFYEPIALVLPMALLAAVDWFGKAFYSSQRLEDYTLAKESLIQLNQKPIIKKRVFDSIRSIELVSFNSLNAKLPPLSMAFSLNQMVMLTGNSGVGKTRLLKAVSGLNSHSGQKMINREYVKSDVIFDDILYVEQSPYCLAGSLRQNLLLADCHASDTKINAELERVGLGYLSNLNEWVGTGGRKLSGGELKRLAIARAILSNKTVLLFDEPFESLDNDNIQNLVTILNQLKQSRIIVIASHINPQTLKSDVTLMLDELSERRGINAS